MTRSARWSSRSPPLLEICGVGTLSAAKIVGETADARRFKSKDAFARYSGHSPPSGVVIGPSPPSPQAESATASSTAPFTELP